MRIPGWLIGIGVIVFIMLTGVCALATFGLTRQAVIDMQKGPGILFESPGDALSVLLGYEDPFAASATPTYDPYLALTPVVVPTIALPTATPMPGVTYTPAPTAVMVEPPPTISQVVDNDTLPDPRRITILLLGIDQRSATDDPGPFRTDTMIVVSIDPVRKSVGMISIPRDLWVTIPGYEPNRVNSANLLGDGDAYPGGGPALAAVTVSHNLGVHVDNYILVNFDAFVAVVETLTPDGLEVCVEEYIDDPDYPDALYGTLHVTFQPGCQIMDSEQLLQYARTRATSGGDFDRARRQQQVLTTMREHVLSVGGITTFITQAPRLWEELAGSFRTDLTLEEIIALGRLMGEIDSEDVHSGVISNLYINLGTTATGDQVLIPRTESISFLIQQTFFPHEVPGIAELRELAEGEAASIVVFNNTDTQGLATQTSEWLVSQGVRVAAVDNVPNAPNLPTYIQDYTGNPWTARYLAALLGLTPDRIQPGADGLTAEDVMVVVGPDIVSLMEGE